MSTNLNLLSRIARVSVQSFAAAALCFVSVASAEEAPQASAQRFVGVPSDPQSLSPKEYQEYQDLVADLQSQLNRQARFFVQPSLRYQWLSPHSVHLNVRIEEWLRTIQYVQGATVNLPLFLSDPPQLHTQLQLKLKNDKVVVDNVRLTFPVYPSVRY